MLGPLESFSPVAEYRGGEEEREGARAVLLISSTLARTDDRATPSAAGNEDGKSSRVSLSRSAFALNATHGRSGGWGPCYIANGIAPVRSIFSDRPTTRKRVLAHSRWRSPPRTPDTLVLRAPPFPPGGRSDPTWKQRPGIPVLAAGDLRPDLNRIHVLP